MSLRFPYLAVVGVLCATGLAFAQSTAQRPASDATQIPTYLGEVTTDNLYVRSGPDTNFYPVIKIHTGDRVRVTGLQGDWLAIDPPEDCFSLIADDYVDVVEPGRGVTNSQNIRVRAGSNIYPKQFYQTQTKLPKGAEVKITGHLDKLDSEGRGYYQIVPPAGVQLWVHRQYIERVPEGLIELENAGLADLPPDLEALKSTADPSPTPPTPASPQTDPAVVKARIEGHRAELEEVDAALKAELGKPLMNRNLTAIIDRFVPLAEQEDDEYSALYATTRIAQLREMVEMIDTVHQVRALGEQIKADRKTALTARSSIRTAPPPVKGGFDAEGELRYSAIYDSPAGPQRYRLVDPHSDVPRTLGYVEIPPDSGIDASQYIGRVVGVRARDIRLQAGEVDPIMLYIASSLEIIGTPSKAPAAK